MIDKIVPQWCFHFAIQKGMLGVKFSVLLLLSTPIVDLLLNIWSKARFIASLKDCIVNINSILLRMYFTLRLVVDSSKLCWLSLTEYMQYSKGL